MQDTTTLPRSSIAGHDGPSRSHGEASAEAERHSEGLVARTLEGQTARLPSDLWLWAAVGSMGASLFFHVSGDKDKSVFVGQWAAPLLMIGVYNKLIKIGGSDRVH